MDNVENFETKSISKKWCEIILGVISLILYSSAFLIFVFIRLCSKYPTFSSLTATVNNYFYHSIYLGEYAWLYALALIVIIVSNIRLLQSKNYFLSEGVGFIAALIVEIVNVYSVFHFSVVFNSATRLCMIVEFILECLLGFGSVFYLLYLHSNDTDFSLIEEIKDTDDEFDIDDLEINEEDFYTTDNEDNLMRFISKVFHIDDADDQDDDFS